MSTAVFPLYYTGREIQHGNTASNVSVSNFMKYTSANIKRGSWRYWCAQKPRVSFDLAFPNVKEKLYLYERDCRSRFAGKLTPKTRTFVRTRS